MMFNDFVYVLYITTPLQKKRLQADQIVTCTYTHIHTHTEMFKTSTQFFLDHENAYLMGKNFTSKFSKPYSLARS